MLACRFGWASLLSRNRAQQNARPKKADEKQLRDQIGNSAEETFQP